jgi:4-oxalocrotonate tautomerase family enzyme
MPYIHVASAHHYAEGQKRPLIRAITDATVDVLEVPAADVHVFLWEIPTENLGYAGDEPSPGRINNVTVVFRKGRHQQVRIVLMQRLTDVIQAQLQAAREAIHIILSQVTPEDISEGGIPMGPPPTPTWQTAGHLPVRNA